MIERIDLMLATPDNGEVKILVTVGGQLVRYRMTRAALVQTISSMVAVLACEPDDRPPPPG